MIVLAIMEEEINDESDKVEQKDKEAYENIKTIRSELAMKNLTITLNLLERLQQEFEKTVEEAQNGECHTYILTNNHVVDKAHKFKIATTDGNSFNGTVVGTDDLTDLAVVKVESKEALPFAQLGNSDELKIGQIVF